MHKTNYCIIIVEQKFDRISRFLYDKITNLLFFIIKNANTLVDVARKVSMNLHVSELTFPGLSMIQAKIYMLIFCLTQADFLMKHGNVP